MSTPLETTLAHWSLSAPEIIAETGIATVWKVRRAEGPAALKIYHDGDMKNEAPGFDLLRDLEGRGAAEVYAQDGAAILMEWLDGPSLGDLSRGGEDEASALALAEVARQIHASPLPARPEYPTLEMWYQALFDLRFGPGCPDALRRDFEQARVLARRLLDSQVDVRPLHGDLHQDNVIRGPRGWCAFDAKGVVGERTYELANAFRNPKGADALMRDPARIARLLDVWCAGFEVDRRRMLEWVVAKSALSVAWSCGGVLEDCVGSDLVGVFIGVLEG